MSTPTEHLLAKLIVTHYVRNLAPRTAPMIDWQDSGQTEELTITLSSAHARRQIVLRADDVLQPSRTAVWKGAVRMGLQSLIDQTAQGGNTH
jgi:hypothetical protein